MQKHKKAEATVQSFSLLSIPIPTHLSTVTLQSVPLSKINKTAPTMKTAFCTLLLAAVIGQSAASMSPWLNPTKDWNVDVLCSAAWDLKRESRVCFQTSMDYLGQMPGSNFYGYRDLDTYREHPSYSAVKKERS